MSTGTAAHIFAAAGGGPRGSGGLAPALRSAIRNGVWLCANCGRLVDANRGAGFPPSLLRSWRDLREARARIEQAGLVQPIGWISTLTIDAHPLFEAGTAVRFSRFNLVVGNNESGKTSLIDLLRLLDSPRRAAERLSDGQRIDVSVAWHDPQEHDVKVHVERASAEYYVDGVRHPLAPRLFRLLELEIPDRWNSTARPDPIEELGIERLAVPGLLDRQRESGAGVLRYLHTDGTDLWAQFDPDPKRVPMAALSGGMWARIRLDLGFALAAEQAKVEPTLLLMDDMINQIDTETVHDVVLGGLPRADAGFQTVITTWRDGWEDLPDWNVIELRRSTIGRRVQLYQRDS